MIGQVELLRECGAPQALLVSLAYSYVSDLGVMDLSETELRRPGRDGKTIEALALALDIAITVYDRHDTLIAASPEFQRFFDVPAELLQPGARLRDLLGAAYESGARVLGSVNGKPRHTTREDWIAERIAIHWRERYESVEKLADGRWIRLSKRRMPDGVLVSTIADVSEQKRRDIELAQTRHQAELAQHILDNLANPVMVKDSSLRYVIVNDAFCRIPGLHAKHVVGRTARELVDPTLATHFETIERNVLETGVPFETTEDIIRADGTIMHAVTRARRSGAPGNYYVTVSFDDLTAFVESESYNARARSRYDIEPPGGVRAAPTAAKGRIVVLDANSEKGLRRVAEIKAAGSEAVAISDAAEAFAFFDAAASMQVTISDVEVCDAMTASLQDHPDIDRHPLLARAVETRRQSPVATPAAQRKAAGSRGPAAEPSQKPSPAPVEPGPTAANPGPGNNSRQDPRTPAASGARQPSVRVQRPNNGRIRVLVAEDNDVNQIVFEQILEGIGVDFRIVGNGEEAVAAWRAAPPDLILMDISMPVMNGLQAARAIRDAEAAVPDQGVHTPIIAVTAHAMSGDRERCFAAGMDDYLSKPVSPEKLESIIRKWIDRTKDDLLAS
jgi:PAS domain S-box-containing protein